MRKKEKGIWKRCPKCKEPFDMGKECSCKSKKFVKIDKIKKDNSENNKIKIRRMKLKDIFRVGVIHRNPETKNNNGLLIRNWFFTLKFFFLKISGKMEGFVLVDNNKVVGVSYIIHLIKPVFGIVIDEKYRGKGHGKKLTEVMLENQKEVYLDVHERNIYAIRLYERFGFKVNYKMLNMVYRK